MKNFSLITRNSTSNLWEVPAYLVFLSIVLVFSLIYVDAHVDQKVLEDFKYLGRINPNSALTMVSTIASAMITAGATVFTITIVALTLASMQFSPRVLGNFMHHRTTQVVLGSFLGVFVYSLILFRVIKTGDNAFVPLIALEVNLLLAILSIGILIVFIYQISVSIQASHIASRVVKETYKVIDKIFPDSDTAETEIDKNIEQSLKTLKWHDIPSFDFGFIQYIDEPELIRLAKKHQCIFRIRRGCGAFIVENEAMVYMASEQAPDANLIKKINNTISIGTFRTVEQDIAFGIWELVDMALKALSLAVNDTSTGVMCVNHITAILARIVTRKNISGYQYDRGELRLITVVPTFENLLNQSFDQIRHNAVDNIAVIIRMLHSLNTIGSMTTNPQRRAALLHHIELICELANVSVKSKYELDQIQSFARHVTASWGSEMTAPH